MQQELWIKRARTLLNLVTVYMRPQDQGGLLLREAIVQDCRNFLEMEIDAEPEKPSADLPAPWNRREGC